MVTIQNRHLTVIVAKHGAELQSIRGADGHEYLWHGDPQWYPGRAPVIFPICGRLPNNTYTYEGNAYTLGMHGFAHYTDFAVTAQSDTAVTFRLCDTEQTRAVYPFAFCFSITFALCDSTLHVTYDIHNPAATPLFASFGSHEIYHCPEGLAEYELVLPQKTTLDTYLMDPHTYLLTDKTARIFDNEDTLPVTYDWFKADSLIFKHPDLAGITLRHRQTGRTVTVGFENVDNLVLWTLPGAPFLCIEPWWGMCPIEGGSTALLEKPDLHRVDGGDTLTVTHTITVGI